MLVVPRVSDALLSTKDRHQPRLAGAVATPQAPPVTGLEIVWWLAGLVVVLGCGALKLAVPLHRDPATFLWLASQLDRGAVLYVDIWDVKQPGIFIFNLIAGKLFGFSAIGVHLFELLWHVAFAACAVAALRPLLAHRFLAALAPVAALTSYYVFCEPHQQTQLEILVGLPLFVTAWLSAVAWPSRRSRALGFLAAGIAAGVATSFKHILAPIPLGFVIAASFAVWRMHEHGRLDVLVKQVWLPFAGGVVLVWGSIALIFWRLGALDAFLATNFLYPLEALAMVNAAPISRLAMSIVIATAALAPWLIFATFALRRVASRHEPALFGRMGVWLLAGIAVILLQKSSWWAYHMLLLYVPVGILAARGVDLVLCRLQKGLRAVKLQPAAVAALLVVTVVAAFVYPMGETGRGLYSVLWAQGGTLESYRRQTADYAHAADAAAFLQAHAPAGPIYVFGDPTILQLSGRTQAMPTQGSAWDFYLPAQLQRLPADLAAARPVWVFLEANSRLILQAQSPQTIALLARDYRVAWDDTPYGSWYALKPPAAAVP